MVVTVNGDRPPEIESSRSDQFFHSLNSIIQFHSRISQTGDESSLNKMKSEDVDLRYVGWIGVDVEGGKVVQIELKGPDNSLRVRQVKVLDHPVPIVNGKSFSLNSGFAHAVPIRRIID